MAPTRFKSRLIVLFLLMALLSNAHFYQAAEVAGVSTRKGVFNGESVVVVAIDQTILAGRKMAVVKQRCYEKGKKVVAHAKLCKKNSAAASRKVSEDGDDKEFVAFSADYRAPRHHPPKNN
ncbi:hypothetical protein WN944_019961 [Citrus x changshan-huyou]|uniref:Uncharacterized protein n=1 Tax=Citrus x changshan-huyou TaxID=2935761 RepID=A0AAP0LWB6_9ROSI